MSVLSLSRAEAACGPLAPAPLGELHTAASHMWKGRGFAMDSERTPQGPAAGPLGFLSGSMAWDSGLPQLGAMSPESLCLGLVSCRLRVVSGEGPREGS